MMKKITIASPKGRPCPWPGKPCRDLPETPVEFVVGPVIKRLIRDGSVVVCVEKQPVAGETTGKKVKVNKE